MAGAHLVAREIVYFSFLVVYGAARAPNSGEFSPRWLGSHLPRGAGEVASKALSFCMLAPSTSAMADEPLAKKARFATVSDDDIAAACSASKAENTKQSTEFWLRVFKDFCEAREKTLDLETCSPKEMDSFLSEFYLALRNKKGGLYMKASYMAARAALSRYMVKELRREEMNIFRNCAFSQSNAVLDGVLRKKKADGQEPAVDHKSAISDEDLERLKAYFDDVLEAGDPVKLTFFCWFNFVLHFAL